MTEVFRKATGLDKLNGVAGIIDTLLGKSVGDRYYNQRNGITAATKSFAAEILNNGEYLAGCKKPAESTLVSILNDLHKYALNAAEQYEVGRGLEDPDDYEPWTLDYIAAVDPNDPTKLVETNDVDRLHLITSMKAGTTFLKDLAGVTKTEEESINSSAEYEDRYLDQLENNLKEKLLSLGQSEMKHPDSVYVIKNIEVQDAITKAKASAASDQSIVKKAERKKKKKRSNRTDVERDEAVDTKKKQKQTNEKLKREEDNSKANEGTESIASILKMISDNIPTKQQQEENDRVKIKEKIASNEMIGTAVGTAVGNALGAALSSVNLPFRVSPPSFLTHESLFCKYCGFSCTSASKFCNQCGKEV